MRKAPMYRGALGYLQSLTAELHLGEVPGQHFNVT